MVQKIAFYTAEGCHLCEQALDIVEAVLYGDSRYVLELRPINENELWLRRYGIRIPVVQHVQSERELGWPFDQYDLQGFLTAE